jgi:hypothetical protein
MLNFTMAGSSGKGVSKKAGGSSRRELANEPLSFCQQGIDFAAVAMESRQSLRSDPIFAGGLVCEAPRRPEVGEGRVHGSGEKGHQ